MKHLTKKGSSKGTIVCIHGNSSSPKIFESLLISSKINQTVIAIELPGHSENDKNTIESMSSKNICNALIEHINNMDDDIFLLGNSLGGHLAIEIANQIKKLKGLMIFGTPPIEKPINFENAFNDIPELQTFFTENPTHKEIENMALLTVFNKSHSEQIITDFKSSNPLFRIALALDVIGNKWSHQKDIFLNLNIPKFIIKGDEDPAVNGNYLKGIIAHDLQCELISVTQCGHYPTLEQPDVFIDILNSASLKVFA